MKFSSIPAPRALPRGLLAVRCETDPKKIIAQLSAGFEDFKARYDGKINDLEGHVATQLAAINMHGGGSDSRFRPDDPEYSQAFASFFRAGDAEDTIKSANAEGRRAQVQAAMSVGDNSSGGYLAPVEWDRRISHAQLAKSPMRRLATVQSTSVGAYSTLWNNQAWASGWVGEAAARPETTSATLSPIVFGAGEIYANVAATQRILDDSGIDVEQWLASQLEEEFNRQEGIAFITGNGTNKPFGLLSYITGGAAAAQHPGGVLDVVPSGNATLIGADVGASIDTLIGFMYGLAAPYRQNATWLMNSLTAATIAKYKDGDGNLIWRESMIVGMPATLLGRPVEFDENMPNIGAGNMPIAFGDFKAGYLINDRIGTRILRDPYTNKPFVMFYVTKRVGAGVADPRAIRLLKIAAS